MAHLPVTLHELPVGCVCPPGWQDGLNPHCGKRLCPRKTENPIKENGRILKIDCKPSWKKSRAQIISRQLSHSFKALKVQEIPVRKLILTLRSSIYVGSWLRESASERYASGMISPSPLFPLEVVSESLRPCKKEKISEGAEFKIILEAPLSHQQRQWRGCVCSAYGLGSERQKHAWALGTSKESRYTGALQFLPQVENRLGWALLINKHILPVNNWEGIEHRAQGLDGCRKERNS